MHDQYNLPPHLIAVPRLMTVDQTAQYLGITRQALDKARWLGKGPAFIKIGRLIRYKAEDLLAYYEVIIND